ncbi:MAG: hypothetical protein SVR81_09125 [Chloroflexota bacterium]|nr:hypothetical protein [Chloroflexota bacterium]
MAKNKNLDPKLEEQLHQYYDVDPRPGFLPELRRDLQDRYATRPAMRLKLRPALALAGTVIALVLVLFATPVGDALGQVLVELFQTAEDDVLPYPPAQTAIAEYTMTAALGPTSTPVFTATKTPDVTPTPDPASYLAANKTVDEVEETAGFDILVPEEVPEDLVFRGATYDPETNVSRLFYDLIGRRTNGLSIFQEPVTGMADCDLCSDIGPSANVKEVQIGDVTGEYVVGTWILEDGYRIWKNEQWLKRLRWQTDDTVFELTFFGPPATLLSKDFVEIAESMTSENPQPTPTSPPPTATPTGIYTTLDLSIKENADLTLKEVEEAAGFEVLVPAYLPKFEFHGAAYDPDTNMVYLFYDDGLLLRQEPITDRDDCDICDEIRVGTSLDTVQFGDIEAEYSHGIWAFIDEDNRTTTAPQPKRFRWQVNDMLFEIYYDHNPSELGVGDLIVMAKSYR